MLRLPFAGHSRRQRPLSFSRSVASVFIILLPTCIPCFSCPPCDAACHHLDKTSAQQYARSAVVQHRIDDRLFSSRNSSYHNKADNKKNILSRRKNAEILTHIYVRGASNECPSGASMDFHGTRRESTFSLKPKDDIHGDILRIFRAFGGSRYHELGQ